MFTRGYYWVYYIDYTTSVYSCWVTTLVKNWVGISDYITMIFQFPFLSLNIVHHFERLMMYIYKPVMQCYVYPSLYPLHHYYVPLYHFTSPFYTTSYSISPFFPLKNQSDHPVVYPLYHHDIPIIFHFTTWMCIPLSKWFIIQMTYSVITFIWP
jgi:hypothetical protein